MNPLEQHPQLFANGKFKMRLNIYPESKNRAIGKITCFSFPGACGIGALKVDGLGWVAAKKDGRNPKLVARPIEDMTHEEIVEFEGSLINVDRRTALKVITNTDRLKSWGMLNLLSIGVYPFAQSHFDDGTVIDSREV